MNKWNCNICRELNCNNFFVEFCNNAPIAKYYYYYDHIVTICDKPDFCNRIVMTYCHILPVIKKRSFKVFKINKQLSSNLVSFLKA